MPFSASERLLDLHRGSLRRVFGLNHGGFGATVDRARACALLPKNNYYLSAGVLWFDFDEGHDTGAGIDDVVLHAGIAEV